MRTLRRERSRCWYIIREKGSLIWHVASDHRRFRARPNVDNSDTDGPMIQLGIAVYYYRKDLYPDFPVPEQIPKICSYVKMCVS